MVFDIIILIFLLAGFYYGYKKGVVNTIFMLICYLIGTTIVLKANEYMLHYLGTQTTINKAYLPIVSIFILIVFFVLFFKFINWATDQLLKAFHLTTINQVIGAALFATLVLFLLSTVIWYIDKAKLISDETKLKSYTYQPVSSLSPVLMNAIGTAMPVFNNMYQNMNQTIDNHIPTIDSLQHTK